MSTDLLELEQRRLTAFDAGDLDALGALIADDYTHVHGMGLYDKSRAQYLQRMSGRTPGRYETRRGDLIVQDLGDTAIVTGPWHGKLWPDNGDPREVEAIATGVWRRTADSWELVHFQMTKVESWAV